MGELLNKPNKPNKRKSTRICGECRFARKHGVYAEAVCVRYPPPPQSALALANVISNPKDGIGAVPSVFKSAHVLVALQSTCGEFQYQKSFVARILAKVQGAALQLAYRLNLKRKPPNIWDEPEQPEQPEQPSVSNQ
jgi:hypothetical protein